VVAIGLGLAWAGYYVGIYGYCLVRGYEVGFTQLMMTQWPVSFGGGNIGGAGTGDTQDELGGNTFS